jgi:hypothetical protein
MWATLLGGTGDEGAEAAARGVEDPVFLHLRSEDSDLPACGSHLDVAGVWRPCRVYDVWAVGIRSSGPGETLDRQWLSGRR